jgi:hypothetical protein
MLSVDMCAFFQQEGRWARDLVHRSKLQLESEIAAAKRDAATAADSLAEQIENSLIERRAH